MTAEEREKPTWEPPPWEADAFEELKRRREERAAVEAPPEPEPVAPEPKAATGPPASGDGEVAEKAEAPKVAKPAKPDPRVEAMMLGLRAEEPRALGHAWIAGAVAATLMLLIGLTMFVWGAVALSKTGSSPAGLMGASIILVFGAICVALGAWLVQRTVKSKGA